MLTITCSQMNVLAQDQFESWLLAHVRRYFPQQCAHLSDHEVRRDLKEVCCSAREMGLEDNESVARFVDLTFVLGPEFHQRADGYPWVQTILNTIPDAHDQIEELCSVVRRLATRGG
jgi:hypothetical protein